MKTQKVFAAHLLLLQFVVVYLFHLLLCRVFYITSVTSNVYIYFRQGMMSHQLPYRFLNFITNCFNCKEAISFSSFHTLGQRCSFAHATCIFEFFFIASFSPFLFRVNRETIKEKKIGETS